MRIARFSYQDMPHYAFVHTDQDDGNDYLIELQGHPLTGNVEPTGNRYRVNDDGIRLLAPIIPSKIIGIARNYRADAALEAVAKRSQTNTLTTSQDVSHRAQDMAIFFKPSTSVIGPDDPIVIPSLSHDMNFEPEVAVVIGNIAKNVDPSQAMNYVFGFTCVNDVTLRVIQTDEPTWAIAKGFDTSCPLGPWIETDFNWQDAEISFELNGQIVEKASGSTAHLIHSIPQQIAAISSFTTLLPGDVILTGTPDASGSLKPGDEAIVHIEGIGSLRNVIIAG